MSDLLKKIGEVVIVLVAIAVVVKLVSWAWGHPF